MMSPSKLKEGMYSATLPPEVHAGKDATLELRGELTYYSNCSVVFRIKSVEPNQEDHDWLVIRGTNEHWSMVYTGSLKTHHGTVTLTLLVTE